MKKILILFFALLIFANYSYAIDLNEYLNKSYIGIPYNKAILHNKPYILIFANPNDILTITKMASIGDMIYKEFKDDYNFCIINANKNKGFTESFGVDKLPQILLIDTQKKIYFEIDKKYYKKKELREILIQNKNGIPD